MEYVEKPGMKISKITLGTVQLGLQYGIANKNGKPDLSRSFEILQAAVDGGVNSFDTAQHYGDSEVVLGKFFGSEACGLKNPFLTTKFKVLPGKMEELSVEKQIYGFVEQSLKQLGINRLTNYMLHNAPDMYLYGKAVPDTLMKIKKEGLVERVGVSVYTREDIEEVLKNDLYETIQVPMNIMDQRLIKSGMIAKLKERSITVFVRSVFLQGLFFIEPSKLSGNLKDAEVPLKQLGKLAEHEGLSIAQLALAYIRDIEGVASLVIGAETPEQVRENIALMNSPEVSERTRNEIEVLFKEIPVHLLNPALWKLSL